jgi:hypothetical protein
LTGFRLITKEIKKPNGMMLGRTIEGKILCLGIVVLRLKFMKVKDYENQNRSFDFRTNLWGSVWMTNLGLQSQTFTAAIKGSINVFSVKNLVDEVITNIEMTKIFEPKIYEWPDDIGFIYVQPLYESAIMVDGWPRHSGGYIWVCSCRPFDTQRVLRVLENNSYVTLQCDFVEMALEL